jgi:hypothetical protein
MLGALLALSLDNFFAASTTAMFPNSLIIGIVLIFLVIFLLIKIHSPMPFTLMVALILFVVLGGLHNSLLGIDMAGISSFLSPLTLLAFIIGGGIVAFALWKLFGH